MKTWSPTTSIEDLIKRSNIIKLIRQFFTERGVFEVETPTLSQYAVTDVHLSSFHTLYFKPGQTDESEGKKMSLITSPEYHMKRLLAAGSGPIYQICKCFRNHEEISRFHNPEFTMLEWYRTKFDMTQIINEVDDLLQYILDCQPAERISYQKAFMYYLNIDPLRATNDELLAKLTELNVGVATDETDHDNLLQYLFAYGIEPHIGYEKPIVVYHFPASQAALAQLNQSDPRVAQRFEFYFKGIELANGFKELTDAVEQKSRFEQNNQMRAELNLPQQKIDLELLAAMENGLPDCAGVAIGIDRLIMLALNSLSISDVIAFPFDRA